MSELKPRIEVLAAKGRPPGLAVVLVGNNPASEIYVRNKIKACRDLGIYTETITPPASISTEELLASSKAECASRNRRHPGAASAAPQVDTSGCSWPFRRQRRRWIPSLQCGKSGGGLPAPRACTPAGIMEMLRRYEIPSPGKRAVVVGRSDIVGKPMALLLLHQNATVTICHSKTADLPAVCREADILVAAIGRPAMMTADFHPPGATVIDVGINRVEDRD